MLSAIDLLKATRANILRLTDRYDLDQLNKIPEGFNNNLIWNFGHVVVTQQLLCYGLSKLPTQVPAELIDKYRKGSKPETFVDQAELDLFKNFAEQTIIQLETDLAENVFDTYKTYTTSYGITLEGIQEAVQFNNVHEGMHLGTMIALTKLI
jgi:hypothetical protein